MLFLSGVGQAQIETPDPGPDPPQDLSDDAEARQVDPASVFDEPDTEARSPAKPRAPAGSAVPLDDETREQYLAALRGYYRYTLNAQIHRGKVFAWQYASSIVIFVVVILLVLVGVYFSWAQFRQSLEPPPGETKPARNKGAPEDEAGAPGAAELPQTTVKASAQGIEVSSPVLGVIILALSLAFFYLYLAFVYPINEVF